MIGVLMETKPKLEVPSQGIESFTTDTAKYILFFSGPQVSANILSKRWMRGKLNTLVVSIFSNNFFLEKNKF